jgi:transcriptional/translational regulatory protein YebC/TACO1
MPPLAFLYDGLKIYIYDDDHLPIHIHAQRDDEESIFNLIIDNNKLVDIEVRDGGNANAQLNEKDTKKVKKFLKKNWKTVIERWNDIVILKTRIKVKRIINT